LTSGPVDADPGQRPAGRRGRVELGDVVDVEEEHASFPVFRHNGAHAEMVTAELAGVSKRRSTACLPSRKRSTRWTGAGLEKPVIALQRPARGRSRSDAAVGRRMGSHLGDLPRHGCGLRRGPARDLHPVVAQFGSFKLPLVILTPIPLTFLGIMGGHWLFGAPFSATSMIGFIALAGIIVRNSILLVDFIRTCRHVPGTPLTS
jgi:hypothetical protein